MAGKFRQTVAIAADIVHIERSKDPGQVDADTLDPFKNWIALAEI
jgi:hypothetical protein